MNSRSSMSRRPAPTLADYAVIAISPALIMTLVGSLVFFLIEVFYLGEYDTRLNFIMAMFVMAAVLVARIAIERGNDYALLFAIPLGLVTAIATFRFVEFSGALRSLSPLINLGLIGLIWWCANKLTWDSTVVDEGKDASGEGLLHTVGIDTNDSNAGSPSSEPEGTTARLEPQLTPWQRFVKRRQRPHAPGVWVIYFSLAALPIFGFGNWFIPSSDLDSRRYVFKLLVVYVASALGLLLATSFLGLRRYLRQRRLEMPMEMAAAWMGSGAAMIVALLLICALLPRRNAEYSVTQLPIFAGSPTDLWTTEHAIGNEGQTDPENADRTGENDDGEAGQDERKGGKPTSGDGSRSDGQRESSQADTASKSDSSGQQSSPPNSGKGQSGQDGKGGKREQGQGEQGQGEQGQGEQGQGQQNDSQDSSAKSPSDSGESNQGEQGGKGDKGQGSSGGKSKQGKSKQGKSFGDEKQTSSPDEETKQSETPSENVQGEQRPKDEQKSNPNSGKTRRKSQPRTQSKFDPSKLGSALGGTIGQLMKFLYWLVVIAIVAFVVWRYHRQIIEAVRNFFKSLRDLWDSLFGRTPSAAEEIEGPAVETGPPPKPFSSFSDPFLTGMAQQRPPIEVIRYSFEAFEAWGRERGYARGPEQTPHEYAQWVGADQTSLARDASALAELYCRCAFSKEPASRSSVEHLRRLWERLRATPV